jgi:hypothetical protein
MEAIQTRLTAPQLELLRMFSHKVDDNNWVEIKELIAAYFAKKAIEEADRIWDEQNWDDQKVDTLLNTHLRTPYRKS